MPGERRPRRKGVASTFMRHDDTDDTDDTDLQPLLESSTSRDRGQGQVTASSSPMAQPEEEHFEGDHVEDEDEEPSRLGRAQGERGAGRTSPASRQTTPLLRRSSRLSSG